MNISEKIFKFVLKRQPARKVCMKRWDDIQSIAILYPEESIQHIIDELDMQGKEVVFFSLPQKKDIAWLTERPKNDIMELITARRYDLLIDLTQESSVTMKYMAMYIDASFKTGLHMNDGILDMTIDTPAQETPDFLYRQITRYLHMLGGTEN
jgi:pyridoxine 5'-phosphate synthase PdxJ